MPMQVATRREDLILLVQKIMEADGTEQELDELLASLVDTTGMPELSDMIFYPESPDVTPENIADAILAHSPLRLTGP